MAKRLIHWTLTGATLVMEKALEDPKATAVIMAQFDLTRLFPEFLEMTDTQKQLVVYGTKQKLSDSGASEVGTPEGKVESAKKQFEDLVAGKWKGERVNATHAAEDRKLLGELKKASEAVTLQGLLLKQAMKPTEFTADDQAKLDEFLAEMAKHSGKGKNSR